MSKDLSRYDPNSRTVGRQRAEAEMLRHYALRYYKPVSDLLNKVPSDMILLFKTNDCLRHDDRLLGVPVNNITVVLSTTADVILREDLAVARSWTEVTGAVSQWGSMMTRVAALWALGASVEASRRTRPR